MNPSAGALAAERDAYLRQRDEALGERNELRRQLDEALGERNELRRQLDEAIGRNNQLAERIAQHAHRYRIGQQRGGGEPPVGSRERPLLFIHLAKTGGMTLASILARNFALDEFLRVDADEIKQSALGTWPSIAIAHARDRLPDPSAIRAVWGHYNPTARYELRTGCAMMTLLREPIERAISTHYYLPGDSPSETLDAYLERRRHLPLYLDNYCTRVLSSVPELDPAEPGADIETHRRVTERDYQLAMHSLNACALVGVTEQFDETLLVLASDLGWALSDLVYNRENVTRNRPSSVGPAARMRLVQHNAFDIRLLAEAQRLLVRRIDAYPGPFDEHLALFRSLNAAYQAGATFDALREMEMRRTPPRPRVIRAS